MLFNLTWQLIYKNKNNVNFYQIDKYKTSLQL